MSLRSRQYRAVLFDVGGTLIGPRGSYGRVYSSVLSALDWNLRPELLEQAIRQVSEAMAADIPRGVDRFSRYSGGEHDFWLRFFHGVIRRATGRDAPPALADRAVRRLREAFAEAAAWQVFDDVLPVLQRLRAVGVRLGVVSNWDSRLPGLLEALGLAGYFDTVVVSALERCEKPDPRIFRAALERLGAAPEDVLHVGDRSDLDVEGARSAGIDGFLVERDSATARYGDLRALSALVGPGSDPGRPPIGR